MITNRTEIENVNYFAIAFSPKAIRIIKTYTTQKYIKILTRWINATEAKTQGIYFKAMVKSLRNNGAGIKFETALKMIQA